MAISCQGSGLQSSAARRAGKSSDKQNKLCSIARLFPRGAPADLGREGTMPPAPRPCLALVRAWDRSSPLTRRTRHVATWATTWRALGTPLPQTVATVPIAPEVSPACAPVHAWLAMATVATVRDSRPLDSIALLPLLRCFAITSPLSARCLRKTVAVLFLVAA